MIYLLTNLAKIYVKAVFRLRFIRKSASRQHQRGGRTITEPDVIKFSC